MQNPNSLISRIYKGRYHCSSTFLQSTNTTHASYGWKSIQTGKELIKQGLCTLIGDGKSTNVWEDHWLPTVPPRTFGYVTQDPDMKVSELICPETKTWKILMLTDLFAPNDVELVKKIRLSRFSGHDKYI